MRVELSDQKKDIFGVEIEDGVEGGLEISLITLKRRINIFTWLLHGL